MFQEMGLSFTHLSPFAQPLANVNSLLIKNFLEHYKEIVTSYQGDQKKELIQDFILGFLNLLKIESTYSLKIQMAIVFLEKQVEICNLGFLDKQTEIDLKYVRIFTNLGIQDNLFINIMVWQKLKNLALKAKKNEVTEVLRLFTKSLATLKHLENYFEKDIINFLENIKLKVTPLQMIPYFDYLNLNPSAELLGLNLYFAIAIVQSCPTEKVERLTAPYLQFKPSLKKLIDACIDKKKFRNLPALVNQKFFTWKEIYYYKGKMSSVVFNSPNALKNLEFISDALDFYVGNIESPDECPDFQDENLNKAINFLMALIFNHQEPTIYFTKLINIAEKLFCYLDTKNIKIPRSEFPYLSPEFFFLKVKASPKETLIMRKKTYNFFYKLTEALSNKLIEHRYDLSELMLKVSQANFCHIALMLSFADRQEETISALLNFSYTMTFLPTMAYRPSIDKLKLVIYQMRENELLAEASTKKGYENIIQLVALAGLPISWFPALNPTYMANVIFDMVKQISTFEHKNSKFIAIQYMGLHQELLDSYLKEKTDMYWKQLNDSMAKEYNQEQRKIEEQQRLEEFAESVLLEGMQERIFEQPKKINVSSRGFNILDFEVKENDFEEKTEDHNSHWILESQINKIQKEKQNETIIEYHHLSTPKEAIDFCKTIFRTDNNGKK